MDQQPTAPEPGSHAPPQPAHLPLDQARSLLARLGPRLQIAASPDSARVDADRLAALGLDADAGRDGPVPRLDPASTDPLGPRVLAIARHDLARAAELTRLGLTPMRVAISGASGGIGSELSAYLFALGHDVRRLVRRSASGPEEIPWDPGAPGVEGRLDPALLEGVDAVIHLAGEPLARGRWSAEKLARIRDSRVEGTRTMARAVAAMRTPPRVLLVASGVGYYGDRGDELLDEGASVGSGFLAETARDWEAADEPARRAGIRTVSLRIGLALSPRSGVLRAMLPAFSIGAGVVPGPGTQWWSWIAMDDLLSAMAWCVASPGASGPINAVAPRAARAREFAAALARAVDRPLLLRAPAWCLRAALGRKADPILTSCHAVPDRLRRLGFRGRFDGLDAALAWELGREGAGGA